MTSSDLDLARQELRDRQGQGARYDAANAPATALALSRRGTAYFARKLNELRDDMLSAPCGVPDWSRRHLIAFVGYQARGLCRLAQGVNGGPVEGMYASAEARDAEIVRGASLPDRALRFLFDHSEVHLNVEWRDLPDAAWDRSVTTFDGQVRQSRDLPMERAKLLWVAAIQLENGGRPRDIPGAILSALGASPDALPLARTLGCSGLR